jgi:hypothetical protein
MRGESSPRLPVAGYSAPILRSEDPLRRETADVCAETFQGVRKMVAAAIGTGRSRVDRFCEGDDANPLEVLTRSLDRVLVEVGLDRILRVPRWLANRYSHDLAVRLEVVGTIGVQRAAASAVREVNEGIAAALEAIHDESISPAELQRVEAEIQQGVEQLHRLLREAQASAAKFGATPLRGKNVSKLSPARA